MRQAMVIETLHSLGLCTLGFCFLCMYVSGHSDRHSTFSGSVYFTSCVCMFQAIAIETLYSMGPCTLVFYSLCMYASGHGERDATFAGSVYSGVLLPVSACFRP